MSHSLFIVSVPNDEVISDPLKNKLPENNDTSIDNKVSEDQNTAVSDDVALPESEDSKISSDELLSSSTKDIPQVFVDDQLINNNDDNDNDDVNDDDGVEKEKVNNNSCDDNQREKDHKSKVQKVLSKYQIDCDIWNISDDKQALQVMFTTPTSNVDDILNSFVKENIGNKPYTSVSILPIQVNFPGMLHRKEEDSDMPVSSEFVQSIKSRLTVAQVINSVQSGSQFTFDYVMLIMMASIIALVGLLENSSVLLVASMLVSPLMGPILGGTFGIVMQYKPLWKMGVTNEIIGLAMCVLVGFVFGFAFIHFPGWNNITGEMISRGAGRSLLVGVLVALPSGAGVALSILGGNAGSLVGVAISASLLPPAVNAGLCWSIATYMSLSGTSHMTTLASDGSDIEKHSASDLATIGALSLLLTIINIFLVFFMGVIILKIKEIAPHTGTAVTQQFFKDDMKTARDYLKNIQTQKQTESLNDKFLDQIMNEAGLTLDAKETIKGKKSRKLKVNLGQLKDKAVLVDNYIPKTFSNAQTLETSVRYLREKLQDKSEMASRFHVSRVYNLVDTAFSTNSRFVVSNIDDREADLPTKKKNNPNMQHLSGITKIRRPSQQSTVSIPLMNEGDESNF